MRDIALSLIIFGLLPRCYTRPDIGVLVFVWLALMNPQRLCYGFAWAFPWAQLVAMALLAGFFVSKEPKKFPWTPTNIFLLMFGIWMFITTFFAFNQEAAWVKWDVVWKILLITFIIMMIMTTKERINNLVWVVALSLAFYGVKGGIFTIRSGGGARVWGPEGTFIGGNNEIGLALLMTIPLLRYMQLNVTNFWAKHGLTAAMLLSLLCALGTQSRGALVGMAAMLLFLVMKSRNKFPLLLVLGITIPLVLSFMPESWYARMHTIQTYQQDGSAMGRINAWYATVNIAKDRVVGGGFKCLLDPDIFALYAPNPTNRHDAHSIYFEVLGEHGFIGLILFLLIGFTTWRSASQAIKLSRKNPELKWIADLCSMVQVSLIGYAVSGAFLGLATFDLYYTLIAIVIICNVFARKHASITSVAAEPHSTPEKPRRSASFVKPPLQMSKKVFQAPSVPRRLD